MIAPRPGEPTPEREQPGVPCLRLTAEERIRFETEARKHRRASADLPFFIPAYPPGVES